MPSSPASSPKRPISMPRASGLTAASGWRRAKPMQEIDERALVEALVVAARAAGAEILKLVARGFEIETKSDASPVTVCDRAAEAIILDALAKAAPGVPVIAEEEV